MLKKFVFAAGELLVRQTGLLAHIYVDGFQGDKVLLSQIWGTYCKLTSLFPQPAAGVVRVCCALTQPLRQAAPNVCCPDGGRRKKEGACDSSATFLIPSLICCFHHWKSQCIAHVAGTWVLNWMFFCVSSEDTVNWWCGAELLGSNMFLQGLPQRYSDV